MASPGPAAGGHGAGEEALPASSPPRQEHAWHRHGSAAAPPHAPPPSEEQGRHLASAGGGGWGCVCVLPGRMPSTPASPGAHKPTPLLHSVPAVTPPGDPAGAGEGLSPAALSLGCRMHRGTQVPGGAGSQAWWGVPLGRGGSHCLAAPPAPAGSKPWACLCGEAGSRTAGQALGYQDTHSGYLSASGKPPTASPPRSIPTACLPASHQ